jgi:hypothetical protein
MSLLSISTISQYILFAGIGLILFGWIEKKEKLTYSAQIIFILLGIFSAIVLSTISFHIQPDAQNTITKEIKAMMFLKLAVCFAGLNLISLLLGLFKNRFYKLALFLIILGALGLFFLVFGVLETA